MSNAVDISILTFSTQSVISMTFGRPAMISRVSSGAVPLPLIVDDEFISSETTSEPSQQGDQPSIMWFYAKTLELYEIMNDVLLSLYKPVLDDHTEEPHDFYFNSVVSEGERTIFDLDRSLTRWTRGLPRHLGAESSIPQSNSIFFRQKIVLHARCVKCHIDPGRQESITNFLQGFYMSECFCSVPRCLDIAPCEIIRRPIRLFPLSTPFPIGLPFNAP